MRCEDREREKEAQSESLIPQGSEIDDRLEPLTRWEAPKSNKTKDWILMILIVALFNSIIFNISLFKTVHLLQAEKASCPSQYTGLGYNVSSPYHIYTDFIDANQSVSDSLWESLDSSPIMVALDADYANQHSLKTSIPFPWDHSKGLYHIKAFHHIHCLKNIRRAYFDALEAGPSDAPLIPPEHIGHCLDTIRQDLMCNADDTPMPTINERHKIGDGQVRQCKDWDALIRWTQAPERQACFKMIDEYRRVPNSLEEFAFCPENSQNEHAMKSYFAKWGHKNPFGDESEI